MRACKLAGQQRNDGKWREACTALILTSNKSEANYYHSKETMSLKTHRFLFFYFMYKRHNHNQKSVGVRLNWIKRWSEWDNRCTHLKKWQIGLFNTNSHCDSQYKISLLASLTTAWTHQDISLQISLKKKPQKNKVRNAPKHFFKECSLSCQLTSLLSRFCPPLVFLMYAVRAVIDSTHF